MSDLTQLIEAAQHGDRQAAADVLPLIYDELKKLAASRMAGEAPGHTLSPTALVHEAYLRLLGDQKFDGRGHFFFAAAEAMRRILIEKARQKSGPRRGGQFQRIDLDLDAIEVDAPQFDILALDEALTRLADESPVRAELVKLRFFAGLTMAEVAQVLGISLATAERYWVYSRTRLFAELKDEARVNDSPED